MDAIVMPHDPGPAADLNRPVDLHDPAIPVMDHTSPEISPDAGEAGGGADTGESGEMPPYGPTEQYVTAMSKRRRRQSVVFGASALIIALAAGGFIAHKPLLAALARLRDHDLRTAAIKPVPLPHPLTSGAALKAGNAGHTTVHPLDNAIPGMTVTPAVQHPPSAGSAKPLSPPPGGTGTAPSTTPPAGTGLPPLIPTNGVPRATTTQAPPIATTSTPAVGSAGITPRLTATAATLPLEGTPSAGLAPSGHPNAPLAPATPGKTAPGGATPGSPAYSANPLVGPLPPKGTLQSIPHPVEVAAKLVAAPASTSDEVKTDALVSALGQLVGELRSENMQMQNEITAMRHDVDAKLTSFNARLTFDQAHDTLALAGAAHPPFSPPAVSDVASNQIFPAHAKPVAPVNPASYHIQAASQGRADIYRNGVPYEVSVGSVVPGVGRVISISQYGSTWIVRTDHGVIR